MKINGKFYKTPALNCANLATLEGWGIKVEALTDRPLGLLCGFVALAIGGTLESGARAIDDHIEGGGSMDDLILELTHAIKRSNLAKAVK